MTHCPVHPEFDPLDLSNPFPVLAGAQREQPVFYDASIDYWIVTRHADIKAIFKDHRGFTAENTITPIVPFPTQVLKMLSEGGYTPEPVLSNNVPPSHTRIRKQVNKLFAPRRMQHFGPAIRSLAEQAISGLPTMGPFDLVSTLTYEFPAQVLFLVLGVPEADVAQVKYWAGNRIKLYYGRPTKAEQIELTQRLIPFWHYVVELVNDKVHNPKDDLTSDLIRARAGDDSVLTLNEIASCMITLLVAGHETTTAQLNNGLLHLLSEREQWRSLQSAPGSLPAVVEEMMRFDPSVCTWRRFTHQETVLGDVTIPAQSNLLLMLNAANRDPAVFSDANTFDHERDELKEHLALGHGIHYCVGAPLARLEMSLLLETIAVRCPSLTLVPERSHDYLRNISFRGPTALWVQP